jgi:hypothetical protein
MRFRLFVFLFALRVASIAQEARPPQLPTAVPNALPDSRGSLEGKRAKLKLLVPVSSKSPNGSSFMAQLEAPIEVAGTPVVAQGSILEGHLETTHARRPLRGGTLRLIFDRIKLPDGTIQPARVMLVQAESQSARADSEGTLRPTLSKKRLAFQLGGTALAAKLSDDLVEETLAASAGSARWAGLAGGAVFLLIQKGREVKLKQGDLVEIEFVREGEPLPVGSSAR